MTCGLERLAQVVEDFLQNAAKFTSAGGRVRVSTTAIPSGHAALRVVDTGAGIGLKGAVANQDIRESGSLEKVTMDR